MNLRPIAILSLSAFSYLYIGAATPQESTPSTETEQTESTTEPTDTIVPGYTELDDFVVVERKKLVQSDGAKLTYNVTEDPEAGSSNILDVLRKVPGVTVDAEENVKVNGQSSFKVLMNGREDPLLKGDLKTILKSIPAASIRKIEVISEPGAKYEAEGAGGILNIVTEKTHDLTGYMTQISAWANAYQIGGNVNARGKINKVMLDGRVTYNDGSLWSRSNSSESTTENFTDSPNHLYKSRRKNRSTWGYTGVNLNMSWEPDTLNLFTLSADYGYNPWKSTGSETRESLDKNLDEIWSLRRSSVYDNTNHGLGTQASYQHTFGKDGHNIVASYMFSFDTNRGRQDYNLDSFSGDITETPWSGSNSRGHYNGHVFQIDYANPFNRHHTLEAGAKMNLVRDYTMTHELEGASADDAVEVDDRAINMKQFKDIYALYASYTGSFDKWSVKGGLRYEYTRMGLRYRVGDHQDFTSELNDLVPNAAVSYNFTPASSLRAAYSMRISRPGLWCLNPYVNTLTPGTISYGNPDLESTKSHRVSLTYSNYEGKFGGQIKVAYGFSDNDITDIMFIKDGIINSTYANVGQTKAVQFEGNFSWSITNDLRWSAYAYSTYQHIEANSEQIKAKKCGWYFNGNTDISYTLPFKLRISAYAGMYTPWIDLQSEGKTTGYWYGLGFSRSFLKDDALTLSLSANNFAPYKRTNKYVQEDSTMRLTQVSTYKQWNVGFNISFRFGGLKAQVKRTNANVESEQSGGGSSKGNK